MSSSPSSSSVPPEFRVTFPLSVGCVDAFHPNSLFPILAALPSLADSVSSFTQLRANEKTKTDEYLLFAVPHLQNYNVKFGEGGRSYDVKQKLSSPSDAELWINVTKGTLSSSSSSSSPSSSSGDIAALATALRASAAATAKSDSQRALNEIADALSDPAAAASSSSLTRVFTRKHLCTLKVPLTSSQTFILEQIDFSVWPSSAPSASSSSSSSARHVYRSISLEGSVPVSVKEHLLQLLNSTTFVYGGFPTMLASVLKTASKPLELVEAI